MNNLKKILSLSVACVAMISIFAACNKKAEETPSVVEPAVTDEMFTEDDMAIEEEASEIDEALTEDATSDASATSESTEETK